MINEFINVEILSRKNTKECRIDELLSKLQRGNMLLVTDLVYAIGNFSKEVCGGPHVEHTSVLGRFELGKQETIGSGKRRIYGYLK